MAYTPFPTFSSPEGGGITAVKMPASQMRFPTSSYNPRQREPKPELIETIAPFLPLVTEGIMGMFKDEPEQLSREKYLESLGGLSEEGEEGSLTLQEILEDERKNVRADAYELYGDSEEKPGFGLSEIANMAIASQMGRGADDYARTYGDIRKARETSRLTKETNRTAYLSKGLEEVDNLQHEVFEDTDAAALGIPTARNGFIDPRGEIYIEADDRRGYVKSSDLEGNWVPQKETSSYTEQFNDPKLQELYDRDIETVTVDGALLATVGATNEVITLLNTGIADPKKNPLTVVNAIGNIANSVRSNVESVYSYMTFGDENDNGEASRVLFNALQSGDESAIELAMANYEGLGLKGRDGTTINFKKLLGDAAYANVRTKSAMLQLAYMAAAANGQTGRTLSDRDLAYHLDMIGFGNTDEAQTAKENLLGFVDGIIGQHDNRTRASISLNRISTGYFPLINRAGQEDKRYTSALSSYWIPPTIMNEEGQPVHDWSATEMGSWEFRGLLSRHRFNPTIEIYNTHNRKNTQNPFDAPGTGTSAPETAAQQAAREAAQTDNFNQILNP